MKKILVIGEILVEIMADTRGDGFTAAQPLTGPFPSGAPAIFADQAAKLGQPVSIVSAVGKDDFGQVNLDRLRSDGVDVSGVFVDPARPTGSAFVRYRNDGSRHFVFNIRHSAAGHLHVTPEVEAQIAGADHLHVMGSSLSSGRVIDLIRRAGAAIRARGGTLSFDPNLRPEILSAPETGAAIADICGMTDLLLPSGDELTGLAATASPEAAIDALLSRGITAIVHKRGAAGASYHDRTGTARIDAFTVDETDPTGAGDCFGATFTVCWLRGMDPRTALRLAAASGAHAVTKRGPMEGTTTMSEIEAFIDTQKGVA